MHNQRGHSTYAEPALGAGVHGAARMHGGQGCPPHTTMPRLHAEDIAEGESEEVSVAGSQALIWAWSFCWDRGIAGAVVAIVVVTVLLCWLLHWLRSLTLP